MEEGHVVSTFTSKKGRTVLIRALKKEDLHNLLSYANTLIAEDTFLLLSGELIPKAKEAKYLLEELEKQKKNEKIHFVVEVDGKFAGSCEVRKCDRRKSHVGDIGISLGKEYRDEGIGLKCMDTLMSEAKKIGITLLTLTCFAINDRAIHLYEKCGFVKAGLIPGMFSFKGKFEDEIIMYRNI